MPTANDYATFGKLYADGHEAYTRTIELIKNYEMASEEDILFTMLNIPSDAAAYIDQTRKIAIHDGSSTTDEVTNLILDEENYENETLVFAPFNNYGDVFMAAFKEGEEVDFKSKVIMFKDLLLLSKAHG